MKQRIVMRIAMLAAAFGLLAAVASARPLEFETELMLPSERPFTPPTDMLPARPSGPSSPLPLAADTTWFGHYQMIGGEAHAVVGETWTFDHGSPDPLEGWTVENLTVDPDPGDPFRVITPASWAGHGNPPAVPKLRELGFPWIGTFEDDAVARCWLGGFGYGDNVRQRITSPVIAFQQSSGDVDVSFRYFSDSEFGWDSTAVTAVLPDGSRVPLTSAGLDGKVGDPTEGALAFVKYTISDQSLGSNASCRIEFEFTSDVTWSDEDDMWDSEHGGFGFTNFSLLGRGTDMRAFQGLSSTNVAATLQPGPAGARFGNACDRAGDVNGDGYDDVIVGQSGYSSGGQILGRAYVYHGGPGGLSTTASWSAQSADHGSEFGQAVSGAGDINGDGYDDVIVGAPLHDVVAGQQEGRVFVFHGGPTGLSAVPATVLNGSVGSGYFGYDVDCAGDVNGDGFSDVIVGEPWWENDVLQNNEGRAHVYLGGASGLVTTPHWTTQETNEQHAREGWAVAGIGDIDADGYDDIAVGAPLSDTQFGDEGYVLIMSGSPGGIDPSSTQIRLGGYPGAQFGRAIASRIDVNGDGFDDLVASAPEWSAGKGAVEVHAGSVSGLIYEGDLLGDVEGQQFGDDLSSVGDINGDGRDDLLVGSPTHVPPGQAGARWGRAQVFSVGPGVSTTIWTVTGSNGTSYGDAVAGIGDVNGDATGDILVCAPWCCSNAGQAMYYQSTPTNDGVWTTDVAPGNPVDPHVGVVPVSNYELESANACVCGLDGNVLEMHDAQLSHPDGQHFRLISPVIDLTTQPQSLNTFGFMFDMYSELPQAAGLFFRPVIQYYPYLNACGQSSWSPIGDIPYNYTGETPLCVSHERRRDDLTALGADRVRIVIDIYCSCDAFAVPPNLCDPQRRNFTPLIDNIRGFLTKTSQPAISLDPFVGQFATAFPVDGSLKPNVPGNCDAQRSYSDSALGDSLVVQGPNSGPGWEGKMWWRLPRTGPEQSSISSFNTWRQAVSDGLNIVGPGASFTFGLMDSVQVGSAVHKGKRLSEFREQDDDFAGENTNSNEMLPDGVFTPGTKVQYFITSNYVSQPSSLFYLPDTTGGNFFEFEVLPSYRTTPTGSVQFPSLLLVSSDEASTYYTERALNSILGGVDVDAPLPTNRAWDRYPLRQYTSLLRESGEESSATLQQLLGYRGLILTDINKYWWADDGKILETLSAYATSNICSGNQFRQAIIWNGDDIGEHLALLDQNMGTSYFGDTFGAGLKCAGVYDPSCVGAPEECLSLDPTGQGPGHGGVAPRTWGGSCVRTFDALRPKTDGETAEQWKDESGSFHEGASIAIKRDDEQDGNYRALTQALSYKHMHTTGCPEVTPATRDIVTAAKSSLAGALEWAFDGLMPTLRGDPCGPVEPGVIRGRVFEDLNVDCGVSAGEPMLGGWQVMLQPSGSAAITDPSGRYQFLNVSPGSHTVELVTKPYWDETCSTAGYVIALESGGTFTDLNFGVNRQPGVADLSVQLAGGAVKPGFPISYTVQYHNAGTVATAPQVTLQFANGVSYFNSFPAGTYDAPTRTVTWDLPTLAVGGSGSITVAGLASTGLQIGAQIATTAQIGPPPDHTPTDNDVTFTQVVVGAIDPNDKLVSPVGPIATSTRLEYLIRFQNVGTASADFVTVRDTLDTSLDLSTLQLGPTSHPDAGLTVAIEGRTIVWSFDAISLPDSTSDPSGSQGFVSFSTRPFEALAGGSVIRNDAAIQFDFGPVVQTNETVNTIVLPSDVDAPVELPREFALRSIAPNPTRGGLGIEFAAPTAGRLDLEIYDVSGRVVRRLESVLEPGITRLEWDGRDRSGHAAPAGVYFVRSEYASDGVSTHAKPRRIVIVK